MNLERFEDGDDGLGQVVDVESADGSGDDAAVGRAERRRRRVELRGAGEQVPAPVDEVGEAHVDSREVGRGRLHVRQSLQVLQTA